LAISERTTVAVFVIIILLLLFLEAQNKVKTYFIYLKAYQPGSETTTYDIHPATID
jgi:hypothetical protein